MAKFLKTTTLSFCLAVFGPEGAEANYSVSTKLGESAVYSEDSWWRGMFGSIQYKKLVEMVRGSRIEYEPAFGLNDGIDAVFKNTGEIDPSYYYTFGKDGVKAEFVRIVPGQNAFWKSTRPSVFSNRARSERGSLRSQSLTRAFVESSETTFEVTSQSPIRAFVESSSETSDYDFTDVVHSESDGTSGCVFDISPDTGVTFCKQILDSNIFRRDADKYYELIFDVATFVKTFSTIAFLGGNRVFERSVGNNGKRRKLDELPFRYDGIDKEAYFSFSDGTFTAMFERFGKTFNIRNDIDTLYVIKDATYPTEVDKYSLTEVKNELNGGRYMYGNKEGEIYFTSTAERA